MNIHFTPPSLSVKRHPPSHLVTLLLTFSCLAGTLQGAKLDCKAPDFNDLGEAECRASLGKDVVTDPVLRVQLMEAFSEAVKDSKVKRLAFGDAKSTMDSNKDTAKASDLQTARETARTALANAEVRRLALVDILNLEDPRDLSVRTYVGMAYSNLFGQAAAASSGYFSHSEGFASFEIDQGFGKQLMWNSLTTISVGGLAAETGSGDFITTSSNFAAETGVEYRFAPADEHRSFSGGVFATVGAVGFANQPTAGANDQVGWLARAGARFVQQTGIWQHSFSEFTYTRDPRFQNQNRVCARGRLVVSPRMASGTGRGLGVYLEGAVSIGRGKQEARLTAGLQIDTLSVLRALVGAAGKSAPSFAGQ